MPTAITDNVSGMLMQDSQQGPWVPADGVSFSANSADDNAFATLSARGVQEHSHSSRLHPLKVLDSGVINVCTFAHSSYHSMSRKI